MRHRGIHALVGSLVLLGVFVGNSAASEPASATLDRRQISLTQAATLFCHDFDHPVIRCFSSAVALQADIDHRLDPNTAHANALSVGYVTFYEHAGYAGASMTLSSSQAWLSSIGWNDRISSFKSFGATGNFQEDSPSGGFVFFYGSSARVSYVGDAYNDKFSSLVIN